MAATILKSKRGIAKIPLLIFEILFVIAISYITIEVATDFAQEQTVQQIRIAEEMVMMVNTLVGTSGNSIVEYPADLKEYNLILTSDAIIIRQQGETNYEQVQRTFILPTGYIGQTEGGIIEGKQHVCFERKERVIMLRECPQQNQNAGEQA